MGKSIRNTLFTAVVLTLAALGISWNRQAVESKRPPINVSPAVLAFDSLNQPDQSFPLKLEFSRPKLKLGQYQLLTINTEPNAQLEITTTYPDGSTDNPQTLVATSDENGQYQLRFQLNDFKLLGSFFTYVHSVNNGQTADTSGQFSLDTWAADETPAPSDTTYVYPLLP